MDGDRSRAGSAGQHEGGRGGHPNPHSRKRVEWGLLAEENGFDGQNQFGEHMQLSNNASQQMHPGAREGQLRRAHNGQRHMHQGPRENSMHDIKARQFGMQQSPHETVAPLQEEQVARSSQQGLRHNLQQDVQQNSVQSRPRGMQGNRPSKPYQPPPRSGKAPAAVAPSEVVPSGAGAANNLDSLDRVSVGDSVGSGRQLSSRAASPEVMSGVGQDDPEGTPNKEESRQLPGLSSAAPQTPQQQQQQPRHKELQRQQLQVEKESSRGLSQRRPREKSQGVRATSSDMPAGGTLEVEESQGKEIGDAQNVESRFYQAQPLPSQQRPTNTASNSHNERNRDSVPLWERSLEELERAQQEAASRKLQAAEEEVEARAAIIARSQLAQSAAELEAMRKQFAAAEASLQVVVEEWQERARQAEHQVALQQRQLAQQQQEADKRAWQAEAQLREKGAELASLRQEWEGLVTERAAMDAKLAADQAEVAAQLEASRAQVAELEHNLSLAHEQVRAAQEDAWAKDEAARDSHQGWVAHSAELEAQSAVQVAAHQGLQAELRERTDQYGQLYQLHQQQQQQLADSERYHVQVIQQLQQALAERHEHSQRGFVQGGHEQQPFPQGIGFPPPVLVPPATAIANYGPPRGFDNGKEWMLVPPSLPAGSQGKASGVVTGRPAQQNQELSVGGGALTAAAEDVNAKGTQVLMQAIGSSSTGSTKSPQNHHHPQTASPGAEASQMAGGSTAAGPSHVPPTVLQGVHGGGPAYAFAQAQIAPARPGQTMPRGFHPPGHAQGAPPGLLGAQVVPQHQKALQSYPPQLQPQQQVQSLDPPAPSDKPQGIRIPQPPIQPPHQSQASSVSQGHPPQLPPQQQQQQQQPQQRRLPLQQRPSQALPPPGSTTGSNLLPNQDATGAEQRAPSESQLQLQHQQGLAGGVQHLSVGSIPLHLPSSPTPHQPPGETLEGQVQNLAPGLVQAPSSAQRAIPGSPDETAGGQEEEVAAKVPPVANQSQAGGEIAPLGSSPGAQLLDERSFLTCFIRIIPSDPASKMHISTVLANRLAKLLAPLRWAEYEPHYGTLEDFIAAHTELFVVVDDEFVYLREGARAAIAASMTRPKLGVRAPLVSPAITAGHHLAVTPVAPQFAAAQKAQADSRGSAGLELGSGIASASSAQDWIIPTPPASTQLLANGPSGNPKGAINPSENRKAGGGEKAGAMPGNASASSAGSVAAKPGGPTGGRNHNNRNSGAGKLQRGGPKQPQVQPPPGSPQTSAVANSQAST